MWASVMQWTSLPFLEGLWFFIAVSSAVSWITGQGNWFLKCGALLSLPYSHHATWQLMTAAKLVKILRAPCKRPPPAARHQPGFGCSSGTTRISHRSSLVTTPPLCHLMTAMKWTWRTVRRPQTKLWPKYSPGRSGTFQWVPPFWDCQARDILALETGHLDSTHLQEEWSTTQAASGSLANWGFGVSMKVALLILILCHKKFTVSGPLYLCPRSSSSIWSGGGPRED